MRRIHPDIVNSNKVDTTLSIVLKDNVVFDSVNVAMRMAAIAVYEVPFQNCSVECPHILTKSPRFRIAL